MERSGFSVLSQKKPYDALGARSAFRQVVNDIVSRVVQDNKWFGFCTRVSGSQIDIMSVPLSPSEGFPAKLSSQATAEYTECTYRAAVYKYLLRDFLCYYEAPTVYRNASSGGYNDSYNKCLVTANLNVVARWLGIPYEEAKMLYGARLEGAQDYEDESSLCPYLKLYVTKEGIKKITRPRKDLDLSENGTRVIPVFALRTGVTVLFKKAFKDFYDVTFVKDSGQVRTVNICFDLNKLREVYSDEGKLMEQFQQQYQGDFMNVKTLERGYIRVIEVGTNLDGGATRSINFARIVKIERKDPDITFINTDLDRVVDTFTRCVNTGKVPVKDIVEMLNIFNVGQSRTLSGRALSTVQDLEDWAKAQEMLLSTPFIKQLALFMMGNPAWFDGYTGDDSCKPAESVPNSSSDSQSLGSDTGGLDFDLEFDL